ncbi:MAG: acetylornithine/succinylornithine family transaminase [Caldithrix sp.]|nr:acetylornithine/succinylornithine family transaminase [Caldithrix sp.]
MDVLQADQTFFLNVFKRYPIDVDKGRGVYLYDKSGRAYLDFLAGIAVNALGYYHNGVNEAIIRQLHRNLHLSNFFLQDIQIELAEKVLSLTPFTKLFFTNSGTEAIEGLLKLIKKWGHAQQKTDIIAFEGSFHGRTLGALSVTIQEKYQKNFFPLLPHIRTIPFNDVEAFRNTINERTAAVILEGITGEGGVRPVAPQMVEAMAEGRNRLGYKIIMDEIQTGVGRTGKFYYYECTGLIPNAIATAKGFGGGLPLGALLVDESLSNVFDLGEHGTTYGGNPLSCAAGKATVDIVSDPSFLDEVAQKGTYFKEKLSRLAQKYPQIISDVRGQGLMIGVQVGPKAKDILQALIHNGLLLNIAGGDTLRFVPPLIVSRDQIAEACNTIDKTFEQLYN